MPSPRGIVLDFDGVVLQSVAVKTRAFERLFAGEGAEALARVLEYHKANGGLSRFEKFRHIHREILRRPLAPQEERALGERFSDLVEDEVAASAWVPGAREFLEAWSRRLPLFVASGTPEDELRRIVLRRGLSPFFRACYGSPARKEDILRRVAAELGCRAGELALVGDARNDLDAALSAGARFVGVSPAGEDSPFPEGTAVLPDLRGLARALDLEPAARVRLLPPARLGRLEPGDAWAYLGKDARLRDRLALRLGRAPEPLGRLLRAEALRLKPAFLDLVARLGAGRESDASWWAGTLPWKAWAGSDLFLLLCYRSLALRLAEDAAARGRTLALAVEDPWLLRQLSGELRGGEAATRSLPALWPLRLAAAGLGLCRRAWWLLRMLRGRALQALLSGRGAPPPGGVLLYSYLLERGLDPRGAWTEHYLPGLDRELAAAGRRVLRLAYCDSTGFERGLARRADAVPSILYASFPGLLRALFSMPPRPTPAPLEGVDVAVLLERERWHDLSRAGRCAYLLFHDCCRRLLRTAPWEAVFLPWEGQPQERMLVLAAREAGVRAVGCQHSTVPLLQLPLFAAPGEAERGPWPDLLLCCGNYPLQALERGGMPRGRLELGGSRRYKPPESGQAPPAGRDVLVLLPIDLFQARHLLRALARAYPAGGEGFRFLIKPHPAQPIPERELPPSAAVAQGPIEALWPRCRAAVFSGSTAGLEAWLRGIPALRYRPETLLDVDPCEMLGEEELPTAGDADLRERLEGLLRAHAPPDARRAAALFGSLFAPVAPAAWTGALENRPPAPAAREPA